MAVVLIGNGAVAGAYDAALAGRSEHSSSPADYATLANVAAAFKTQFLAANAALSVPMADADNADIFLACYAAVKATMIGRTMRSTTAADYATEAAIAAAAAKELVAKLA
jgi:hypothetical protein